MNLFFGLVALVLIVVCSIASYHYYSVGSSGTAIYYAVLATINLFSAVTLLTLTGRDYF